MCPQKIFQIINKKSTNKIVNLPNLVIGQLSTLKHIQKFLKNGAKIIYGWKQEVEEVQEQAAWAHQQEGDGQGTQDQAQVKEASREIKVQI